MAIITISRGTYTGGQSVAQCLAERLGYECLSREDLIESATKTYGLPIEKFKEAMDKPPTFWERLISERDIYLNFFRTALRERARRDNLIFHGFVGHLLLPKASHIVKIRVVVNPETRIKLAMERHSLDREAAKSRIEKTDKERGEWIRFLWGVKWDDASLYDAVLNLERMGVDGACEIISGMAGQRAFTATAESRKAIEDAALASRVWAALATDPSTTSTNLKVDAVDGVVTVSGTVEIDELLEAVDAVARRVEGVKSVSCQLKVRPPVYDIGL